MVARERIRLREKEYGYAKKNTATQERVRGKEHAYRVGNVDIDEGT